VELVFDLQPFRDDAGFYEGFEQDIQPFAGRPDPAKFQDGIFSVCLDKPVI
jgi:hypothetical protein